MIDVWRVDASDSYALCHQTRGVSRLARRFSFVCAPCPFIFCADTHRLVWMIIGPVVKAHLVAFEDTHPDDLAMPRYGRSVYIAFVLVPYRDAATGRLHSLIACCCLRAIARVCCCANCLCVCLCWRPVCVDGTPTRVRAPRRMKDTNTPRGHSIQSARQSLPNSYHQIMWPRTLRDV